MPNIANALNLKLPVSVLFGGTGVATQTTNGVTFYNGADITSNSGLLFNAGALQIPGLPVTSPSPLQQSQIVTVNPTSGALVSGGIALGGPNMIIAGDFGNNPWQRGTAVVVAASGTRYTADGVQWQESGAVAISISQASTTPTAVQAGYASQACILFAPASVGITTLGANDYYRAALKVEGSDFVPAYLNNMTFSMWMFCTSNGGSGSTRLCVAFRNAGTTGTPDRSYIVEFTVTTVNSWQFYSASIPFGALPAGGNWNLGNGIGIEVDIVIAAGSNFTTGSGAGVPGWNSSAAFCTANQGNFLPFNNSSVQIALAKLESGLIATPYPFITQQATLARCQRYFQKSYDQGTSVNPATNVGPITINGALKLNWASTISQLAEIPVPLATVLRAVPAVSIYSPSSGAVGNVDANSTPTTATASNIGMSALQIGTAAATSSDSLAFHYTVDASL
jgi:hypothetical protein